MKIKLLSTLLIAILLTACGPYRGFKGVNKKGMKTRKTPSQEIRDGYEQASKRMKRKYRREMKRKQKKMGTKPTPKKGTQTK